MTTHHRANGLFGGRPTKQVRELRDCFEQQVAIVRETFAPTADSANVALPPFIHRFVYRKLAGRPFPRPEELFVSFLPLAGGGHNGREEEFKACIDSFIVTKLARLYTAADAGVRENVRPCREDVFETTRSKLAYQTAYFSFSSSGPDAVRVDFWQEDRGATDYLSTDPRHFAIVQVDRRAVELGFFLTMNDYSLLRDGERYHLHFAYRDIKHGIELGEFHGDDPLPELRHSMTDKVASYFRKLPPERENIWAF
jgi:hypothetical protein